MGIGIMGVDEVVNTLSGMIPNMISFSKKCISNYFRT